MTNAVTADRWVIEGCHWRIMDVLLPSADRVVLLDPPLHEWLRQLVERERRVLGEWARRDRSGTQLWLHVSFLLWLPWYPLRERGRVLRLLDSCDPGRVVRLRGREAISRFLARSEADIAAGPG